MKYITELKDNIEKILSKTAEGEIEWIRINPTTFAWIKNEQGTDDGYLEQLKSTRVDLQSIEMSTTENKFIFQIRKMPTNNTVVLIDTSIKDYEDLNDILEELFFAIHEYFDKKTIDHIEDLLK